MPANAKSVKIDNFAQVDIDRFKRRGFPEVVYCAGKTKEQIKKIASVFLKAKQPLLLTRLDKKTFQYLKKTYSMRRRMQKISGQWSFLYPAHQPQMLQKEDHHPQLPEN